MESISNLRLKLHQLAYFDPVSAGIGLGGLLLQNSANKDAKKSQDKATGNQKELIKRQTQLFDRIQGMVSDYDASGGFDPQRQLDQLATDTAAYSERDMGNSAAASRTLGYRRGDSEPLTRLRTIDSNYKLQYGQMANQIRSKAFGDKISAYQGLNPSSLNTGIGVYGQQAQMYQGQQQPLGGLVSSIQPFLQGKPKVNTGVQGPNEYTPFYH